MNDVPAWVGPTVAISLVVIALCFLVMGTMALVIGREFLRQSRRASAQLTAFSLDLKLATGRVRAELEGYAALSSDARAKIRGAIDTVDSRLKDLDALVEVLQEEAETTALDVAAFVRTVRNTGAVFGTARAALARRRKRD